MQQRPHGEGTQTLDKFASTLSLDMTVPCSLVPSFYVPRSNPDGVAVTVSCINSTTVLSVTVKSFDGQNWESSYATSNIADQSST